MQGKLQFESMCCGFVGCQGNIQLTELPPAAGSVLSLSLLISRVQFSPGNFSLELAASSFPGWWSTSELLELCPVWEK